MLDLSDSITFTTNAASGSATDLGTDDPVASAVMANALLSYDRPSNSYVVSVGSRVARFGPNDVDPSLSSATATVYVKARGNVTDSLTLTKPGKSGRITYEYVAGGYWQHSVINGETGSGTLDAFSYGLPTADSAVPRSGRADFEIDLVGAGVNEQIQPLRGAGTMQADFAKALVIANGTVTSDFYGPTPAFSGEARISSSNAFDGVFRFEYAGKQIQPLTGNWDGKFYGPDAQEVGASFAVQGAGGRIAAVGTLLGRQATTSAPNTTVNPPANSEMFEGRHVSLSTRLQVPHSVDKVASEFSDTRQSDGRAVVSYDAASKTYSFVSDTKSDFLGTPAVGDSEHSFELQGGDRKTFAIYAPVASKYVSVGRSYKAAVGLPSFVGTTLIMPTTYDLDFFLFGVPTMAESVPRVGKAGYAVDLIGTAADRNYNSLLDLVGKGSLIADFASGGLSLDGYVQFKENYSYLSHPSASGRSALSGAGTIASSSNAISGTLSFATTNAYTGTFDGSFFGPAAEELGALFTASDGTGSVASGAWFGAKDPSLLTPARTLATLTKPTTLDIVTPPNQMAGWAGPVRGVTQNSLAPASYTFGFGGIQGGPTVTLVENVATSDAQYATLAPVTDAGLEYAARVLKPGSANSLVALTYTSFADISVNRVGLPADRAFAAFGLSTSAAERPRAGSATYSGVIVGTAGLQSRPLTLDVTGTSALAVDFGKDAFSIALKTVGTPVGGGTAVAFDTLSFAGGVTADGKMSGSENRNGFGFAGQLFGPGAAEFGGGFEATATTSSLPGELASMRGVTVGKKD